MNLHAMLAQRAADGRPLRVALIGAGKFGSMFLSQVRRTPGLHLVAVSDLSPARAKAALLSVGWADDQLGAKTLDDARRSGRT
ncbi:MAG: Gfo/Idh/MocA family oxidoreductase, partial [Methylibium sp.]|nr:Gfo/Idh/MocA family oxidoreductase [Methylibium sp.]